MWEQIVIIEAYFIAIYRPYFTWKDTHNIKWWVAATSVLEPVRTNEKNTPSTKPDRFASSKRSVQKRVIVDSHILSLQLQYERRWDGWKGYVHFTDILIEGVLRSNLWNIQYRNTFRKNNKRLPSISTPLSCAASWYFALQLAFGRTLQGSLLRSHKNDI